MTRTFSWLLVCLCLLGSVHAAQAQGVSSAVRIDGTFTAANFTIGMSQLNDTSTITNALATDQVRLTATINPEQVHVGQQADIYLVMRVGNLLYMRDMAGSFVPWDGAVANLVPYQSAQMLTDQFQLELFVGNIPVTGRLSWFLGYKASDGVLVYNRSPHTITVTQPGSFWPMTRPYVVLSDFTSGEADPAAVRRFLGMADRWVAGARNEYGYSPVHSVIAYALSGESRYLQSAIADVDAMVNAEIALACSAAPKQAPAIAGDSYLGAGDRVQRIALAYDYGYDLLTEEQRRRWLALMEQTVSNIFGTPSMASWGGDAMGCAVKVVPWSGWAASPPNAGNNYYASSFTRAALMLALVTRDQKWLDLVQLQIRPTLASYYAAKVPEGGSREGTGYGVSHGPLFDNYRTWEAATGEDWSQASPHARNTILYWLHATVPTLDKFVPIGDQARVSEPVIYDYHRALMLQAQSLNQGTAEARQARWWLDNIALKRMSGGFNSHQDLLAMSPDSETPTQLSYYAKGAGAWFGRSSWEKDATLFAITAGPSEESHYGQEQGNFMLYKDTWLAVTSNIWSRSGINQSSEARNVLRFERSVDGATSVIGQNRFVDTVAPVINETTDADGTMRGSMDLSVAFSRNNSLVQFWNRDFAYRDRKVTIHDVCTVAAGVVPVWQVHVPTQPRYDEASGQIVAGNLTITPQMAVKPTVQIEDISTLHKDFAAGKYRISLYSNSGCDFTVDLEAQ